MLWKCISEYCRMSNRAAASRMNMNLRERRHDQGQHRQDHNRQQIGNAEGEG
jgi:hypothetical protein